MTKEPEEEHSETYLAAKKSKKPAKTPAKSNAEGSPTDKEKFAARSKKRISVVFSVEALVHQLQLEASNASRNCT
jgi:hypothetical protein